MSEETRTGLHVDSFAALSCPVCAQPNQCARALATVTGEAQPACWCSAVAIDPARLAAPAARGAPLRCLCAACAGTEAIHPASKDLLP